MGSDKGFWERGFFWLETGPGYFRVYAPNRQLVASGTCEDGREVASGLDEVAMLESEREV